MISKPVKRFVELMKSNPDDFNLRSISDGPVYNLIFNDKRYDETLKTFDKGTVDYDDEFQKKEDLYLTFFNTNWVLGLYTGLYAIKNEVHNLNIVERLFLKRNLKIHLNIELRSLLFSPYKAKFLVLKNKLFLFLKNILNIKNHAWIISIILQLLTIGLVLWTGGNI